MIKMDLSRSTAAILAHVAQPTTETLAAIRRIHEARYANGFNAIQRAGLIEPLDNALGWRATDTGKAALAEWTASAAAGQR
jgi:protein-disulfide isomerase-like protein with CxxC motif